MLRHLWPLLIISSLIGVDDLPAQTGPPSQADPELRLLLPQKLPQLNGRESKLYGEIIHEPSFLRTSIGDQKSALRQIDSLRTAPSKDLEDWIELIRHALLPDYELAVQAYVRGDYVNAFQKFKQLAEVGDPFAQSHLARMYIGALGVEQNVTESARWNLKAAGQGLIRAQSMVAMDYLMGFGVTRDYNEAAKWLRIAAETGDVGAEFMLAVILQSDLREYPEAAKWFRKAAEQGDDGAQTLLGEMYARGEGLDQNYAEAARWYRSAASQGNAVAQVNLGEMYSVGRGVPQDHAEAALLFAKAANQGNASAQSDLGLAYERGDGVPSDNVRAYMWLDIASAGGDDFAKRQLDRMAQKMTPGQVAQAQDMARDWRKTGNALEGRQPNAFSSPTQLVATGTGFFVSRAGEIITNYHVVNGCLEVRTETGNGKSLTVVAQDEGNDLALLRSGQVSSQPINFSTGPVRIGEAVVVIGFPLRGLLSSGANVTTGNISALAGPNDDTSLLQITAPVQPGNSGGPLLGASGNVVGIVVSKLDTLKIARATGDIPQNVNFAIKGSVARSFLEANGVEFATYPSTAKLDPTVIAERAIKSTIVVECWK